jgi:hypothetical protein
MIDHVLVALDAILEDRPELAPPLGLAFLVATQGQPWDWERMTLTSPFDELTGTMMGTGVLMIAGLSDKPSSQIMTWTMRSEYRGLETETRTLFEPMDYDVGSVRTRTEGGDD